MPKKPKAFTMLPTPANILDVRVAAGLTQCQAAEMVGLAHAVRWGNCERGTHPMDKARWELFLIKVGRHLLYGPRPGVEVPTLHAAAEAKVALGVDDVVPMVVPKKHKAAIARAIRERDA